jgi:hypothetical protein
MFIVVLTVIISFFMNWVVFTFLSPPACSCKQILKHQVELDKMTQHMGPSNETTDICDFLEF